MKKSVSPGLLFGLIILAVLAHHFEAPPMVSKIPAILFIALVVLYLVRELRQGAIEQWHLVPGSKVVVVSIGPGFLVIKPHGEKTTQKNTVMMRSQLGDYMAVHIGRVHTVPQSRNERLKIDHTFPFQDPWYT